MRDGHDARMHVHERFLPVTRKVGIPRHAVITVSEDGLVNRLEPPCRREHPAASPFRSAFRGRRRGIGRQPGPARRPRHATALLEQRDGKGPRGFQTGHHQHVVSGAPSARAVIGRAHPSQRDVDLLAAAPSPDLHARSARVPHLSVPAQPTEPVSTNDQATIAATLELRSALELAYRLQDEAFSEIEDQIRAYETSLLVVGHENGAYLLRRELFLPLAGPPAARCSRERSAALGRSWPANIPIAAG